MGYKAGLSHIVMEVNRPGSKVNKKEVMEAEVYILQYSRCKYKIKHC